MTFGEFITEKRGERTGLSLRAFATQLSISFTYLSDIEHNRATNINSEILKKLIEALKLNEEETVQFYDLYAKCQKTLPLDITEYVINHPEIIPAFRRAIKNDKKGGDANDK